MKNGKMTVPKVAVKNLRRRPVRTWCMIFFVLMLSFSMFLSSVLIDSMESSLKRTEDRLGAELIVVPKEYEKEMADSLFLGELCSFTFEKKWVDVIDDFEEIDQCTPQLYMASLAADCCSAATQMIVFDPKTDFIIRPWLEKENLPSPQEGELYIGSAITPPEKDSIKFFGENYKVIGQLEKTDTSYDTCVFMTADTAQKMMDSEGWESAFGKAENKAQDLVSSVMIRVKEGEDVKALARKINFSIENAPIAAYTTNGIFSGVMDSVKNLTNYSAILIALIFILVTVALLSVFTITINERTAEFGILASLGVENKKLSGIVLTEGTLIGLAGGLTGSILAGTLLMIFATPIQVIFEIPTLNAGAVYFIQSGIKCLILSVTVSVFSSLYSAWRISRSKLDEIMKGEEI